MGVRHGTYLYCEGIGTGEPRLELSLGILSSLNHLLDIRYAILDRIHL